MLLKKVEKFLPDNKTDVDLIKHMLSSIKIKIKENGDEILVNEGVP